MFRNGVASSEPFLKMRICPVCWTMNKRPEPSPAFVMKTGSVRPPVTSVNCSEEGRLAGATVAAPAREAVPAKSVAGRARSAMILVSFIAGTSRTEDDEAYTRREGGAHHGVA